MLHRLRLALITSPLVLSLTLILGLLDGSSAFAATRAPAGLALSPTLTNELNQVLRAGDLLHQALVGRSDEQIEMSVRDILWHLDRARNALRTAKPHERAHLSRILSAARQHFEVTQTAYGEERRSRLEDGFNQLVNLVRIYRLDKSYSIFFCPKDRTTWVQKGSRGRNPFQSEWSRESCGIRVPR